MRSAIVVSLFGVVSAFAPAAKSGKATSLGLEPVSNTGEYFPETFGKVFDPLGLTTSLDERGLSWFRAAEVKHGRVAMMATVGYWAQVTGFHFGGDLAPSEGLSFEKMASYSPLEAIGKIPDAGLYQILFIIGAVEGYQEMRQPHYIMGGFPGDLGAARAKEEALPRLQAVEVKNGRLAMIGIASFVSAATIPGSVPGIPSFLVPH
mmetsp:Transcript_38222/g.53826  ORF Transcript_38222/g.53826 Transcript_38222/m.53826 type:complete len:206 (+) Transcript_38222:22-639(+)|eukprot:CAMPEP_0202457922 /NCGR_PEP_ID=MMETSP1360-20130828/17707_1 /ASSEMBLY_ACC=CAM_ASM_000848 /TAXON_ID=515479 /ORGANISM="Licmophora paradoxa, Strain CCMP2313" /LENGTH=205 /DNA_ID=CAMNT_0049078151 /DNA_START=19 /DNA_END=636 /DNA_ORIENTATION=+